MQSSSTISVKKKDLQEALQESNSTASLEDVLKNKTGKLQYLSYIKEIELNIKDFENFLKKLPVKTRAILRNKYLPSSVPVILSNSSPENSEGAVSVEMVIAEESSSESSDEIQIEDLLDADKVEDTEAVSVEEEDTEDIDPLEQTQEAVSVDEEELPVSIGNTSIKITTNTTEVEQLNKTQIRSEESREILEALEDTVENDTPPNPKLCDTQERPLQSDKISAEDITLEEDKDEDEDEYKYNDEDEELIIDTEVAGNNFKSLAILFWGSIIIAFVCGLGIGILSIWITMGYGVIFNPQNMILSLTALSFCFLIGLCTGVFCLWQFKKNQRLS